MPVDDYIPKGAAEQTKEKMLSQASCDQKRTVQLQVQTQGMFTGKKCATVVDNPQTIEEKHFLQSNTFLQFDISVSGEI